MSLGPRIFWRERFQRFHADNPQVFDRLYQFAKEAKNRGLERIGMRLLIERARWDMMMETASCDGFKINNNYAPFYARMLMERCPSLRGLFETRKMTGEQLALPIDGRKVA